MKKRWKFVVLALLIVIVAVVLLVSSKDKWPPKKVFGDLVKTGVRYGVIYSTDTSVGYYDNDHDGMSYSLVENYIDSVVDAYKVFRSAPYTELVYKKYNKEYTGSKYEAASLEDIVKNYDIKMVCANQDKYEVVLKYKLYVKDNGWCVTDSSENILVGFSNRYGNVIRAIIDHSTEFNAIKKPTQTPGNTDFEK